MGSTNAFTPPAKQPLFSFGVISDVQHADIPDGRSFLGVPRFYRHSILVLQRAVQKWNNCKKHKFVINFGDIVDGFCPPDQSLSTVRKVVDEFEKFDSPVHHLIGNHCLYNLPRDKLLPMLKIPSADGRAYFEFSPTPEFRFVVLDGYDIRKNRKKRRKKVPGMAFGVALLISLLTISLFSSGNTLSLNHYSKTCPDVESIVTNAIKSAASRDKTIPATLLRMHFHDCLIRGCDGSVLLDSKGHHKAEKDAAPNLSLHGFYVIDNAKRALEAACPGVVSCADILALAARDAVVLSGGPYWSVPKGRKDGRVSRASDIATMPSPTFNISQLQKSFSLRGLSLDDLVALSGAHTIGFAHCAAFQNRIHNFNATHDVDPTLRPIFASKLQGKCPLRNTVKTAGALMDPYSATFDNNYYKLVLQGKSLFSSDQALLGFPKTKALVYKYASSKQAFWQAFTNSIVKLSSINGGQEIRKNCRIVN